MVNAEYVWDLCENGDQDLINNVGKGNIRISFQYN